MSLTWWAAAAVIVGREPDERDAAPLGVADLLAVLLRRRRRPRPGCRGARSACAMRVAGGARRPRRAARPAPPTAPTATRSMHAGLEQRHQQPRDAERDADARVGDLAVAGQRVVPAARADRAERLVAGHPGLEHGAGVVVQPAGDAQVGLDRDARLIERAAVDDRGQLGQPLVAAAACATPSARDPVDERRCRSRGSRPARRHAAACVARQPGLVGEQRRDHARPGTLSSLSITRITAATSGAPSPRRSPRSACGC